MLSPIWNSYYMVHKTYTKITKWGGIFGLIVQLYKNNITITRLNIIKIVILVNWNSYVYIYSTMLGELSFSKYLLKCVNFNRIVITNSNGQLLINIICQRLRTTLRKIDFHFLSNWIRYDCGDSVHLDFEPNIIPCGLKLKDRKTVATIIFHSIWKEREFDSSECNINQILIGSNDIRLDWKNTSDQTCKRP